MRRLLLLAPLLFLTSCSSNVSSGFTVFLSGQWVGQLLGGVPPAPGFSGDVVMNLIQEETGELSGTVGISDPETGCWAGGEIEDPQADDLVAVPLAGTNTSPGTAAVTGSRVFFQILDNGGATITIDGTATNNRITALYTSTGGNCAAHSGNFTASRAG